MLCIVRRRLFLRFLMRAERVIRDAHFTHALVANQGRGIRHSRG